MVQVQLRIPEETIKEIDKLIATSRFKSRSDAIRQIIALYEEREKTRVFYRMLVERSEEVKKRPEILIPLDDIR